jgi:hypothetical protein
MSEDYPVQEPSIETVRTRAVEVLTEHFSNDVMDLEEFERLLDAANRCSTTGELRELLRKLPPLESSKPATDMIPARGGAPVVVDADRVRDHGFLISVLGGTNRAGRWIPARKNFALGLLGGISLDFREALLGPGETDVNVLAVLGGVEIIVPPEMAVEVDGMALLGGFEHQTDAPLRSDPDVPTLRIRGLALLGGVGVEVRLPGETSRQAKRRRRLERRGERPRLMSGPDA